VENGENRGKLPHSFFGGHPPGIMRRNNLGPPKKGGAYLTFTCYLLFFIAS